MEELCTCGCGCNKWFIFGGSIECVSCGTKYEFDSREHADALVGMVNAAVDDLLCVEDKCDTCVSVAALQHTNTELEKRVEELEEELACS